MQDEPVSRREHSPVVLLARHLDGPGGVTRSVTNLANSLAAAGFDVSLLVLFRRRPPRYELDPRIGISYVRNLRPRALKGLSARQRALDARPSRLCDPGQGMTALTDRALRRRLRALPPCTLITHRPALHQAAAWWAPDHVAKLAVEHTSFEVREEYDVAAITEALPRLDRLVLLTDENREHWVEHLGAEDKLSTIPNTVPVPDRSLTSWESPVVLAAGSLIARKGFDDLVRAFAPLVEEFPAWRLRIFGHGAEQATLERLVDELGVGGAVELAGFSSSLQDEMLAASVYAMSSSSEGLPMVLLEAMGVGLPVAAYDCTGVRQLVAHDRTGLLAPQGDVPALRDALRRLMADPDLRRRHGQAARTLAHGYGSESVGAQWRALIETVR